MNESTINPNMVNGGIDTTVCHGCGVKLEGNDEAVLTVVPESRVGVEVEVWYCGEGCLEADQENLPEGWEQ